MAAIRGGEQVVEVLFTPHSAAGKQDSSWPGISELVMQEKMPPRLWMSVLAACRSKDMDARSADMPCISTELFGLHSASDLEMGSKNRLNSRGWHADEGLDEGEPGARVDLSVIGEAGTICCFPGLAAGSACPGGPGGPGGLAGLRSC